MAILTVGDTAEQLRIGIPLQVAIASGLYWAADDVKFRISLWHQGSSLSTHIPEALSLTKSPCLSKLESREIHCYADARKARGRAQGSPAMALQRTTK